MENIKSIVISNNKIKEINLDDIGIIEKVQMNENYLLNLLIETESETEKNKIKKAIFIKKRINNFSYYSFEDDNINMEIFKNEYESFINNIRLLSFPSELIDIILLKKLIVNLKNIDKIDYINKKGQSINYKLIQKPIIYDTLDQEPSLLLELISLNKEESYNFFEPISYLLGKIELINEPGILTAFSYKKNPLLNSKLINLTLDYIHIPEIKKEYLKSKDKNSFMYPYQDKEYNENIFNILKENKEYLIQENLENILLALFLNRQRKITFNNNISDIYYVKEKDNYFDQCLDVLSKNNIKIEQKQKEVLVNFLINDNDISKIVIPKNWFKECSNEDNMTLYLSKEYISRKNGKFCFQRENLYLENKDNLVKFIRLNPKKIENSLYLSFVNTFETNSEKSSKEINEILENIFNNNELYQAYFKNNGNVFSEKLKNKIMKYLKENKNKINENLYLTFYLFINNQIKIKEENLNKKRL